MKRHAQAFAGDAREAYIFCTPSWRFSQVARLTHQPVLSICTVSQSTVSSRGPFNQCGGLAPTRTPARTARG